MPPLPDQITVVRMAPDAPPAAAALRAYFADVVRRYHGRPASQQEVTAAMAEDPRSDLQPPSGLLLVARHHDAVLGCIGLRMLTAGVGQVTRVFVAPELRGHGVGARLLTELERHARERGLSRLQLDTRSDLIEARRLYERNGYAEVAPFNSGPYAEHWYAKQLG
jgi:GNAT superfamily N-acetyltransferase